MSLETANKFADQLKAKNVDAACELLTENAEMDTPMMGTKKGREKIRGTLKLIMKMGGGQFGTPEEKNGDVFVISSGPLGKMLIVFGFEGDAINHLNVSRL